MDGQVCRGVGRRACSRPGAATMARAAAVISYGRDDRRFHSIFDTTSYTQRADCAPTIDRNHARRLIAGIDRFCQWRCDCGSAGIADHASDCQLALSAAQPIAPCAVTALSQSSDPASCAPLRASGGHRHHGRAV